MNQTVADLRAALDGAIALIDALDDAARVARVRAAADAAFLDYTDAVHAAIVARAAHARVLDSGASDGARARAAADAADAAAKRRHQIALLIALISDALAIYRDAASAREDDAGAAGRSTMT